VITACASGFSNMDGIHANGCECEADTVGNSCNLAFDLGSVPIGGAGARTGNLVPAGDSDWYKITFQPAASCSFSPRVTLNTSAPVALQVYTSCSGSSPAGSFACVEGGNSIGVANLKTWEFTL